MRGAGMTVSLLAMCVIWDNSRVAALGLAFSCDDGSFTGRIKACLSPAISKTSFNSSSNQPESNLL